MRLRFLCAIIFLVSSADLLQAQEWTALNDGLNNRQVYCITVNPDDPDELYAGTEGGLFRSTNGGERWNSMQGGLPVRSVWVSDDGNTVLIARAGGSRSDGIWISQNGGNFEVLTWILWPYSIAVDPENDDHIFAGSRGGFIYTLNGGGQWGEANEGLGSPVYHLAVKNLDDEAYIFASTGRGLYVSQVGDEIDWEDTGPLDNHPTLQTAFSFAEDEGIFAGTGDESDSDGIYYSGNLGAEWEISRWCFYVYAVETMPALVIMASGEIGVFRSHNNGEDWTEMNQELDDFDINDLLLIERDDELFCYAAHDGDGVLVYPVPIEGEPLEPFNLLIPADTDTVEPDNEHEIPFTWQPAIDPDDDEVTYEFYFDFIGDVPFAEDLEDTTWVWDLDDWDLEMPIPFGEVNTWWVVAISRDDARECEARFEFLLQEPDWPPEPFDLLEPANDDTIEFTFTTFRWQRAPDVDNDEVTYEFRIGHVDEEPYVVELDTTVLTIGLDTLGIDLNPGDIAEWYVIAMSGDTTTECNERFRFTYLPLNHPPSAFSLLEPRDRDTLATALITFSWEASYDPDPNDEVHYYWIIEQDECAYDLELDTTVLTIDIDTTGFEYQNYPIHWAVMAVSDTMRTWCNEPFEFTILPHGVKGSETEPANDFRLYPAFPNPFNASTTIRFDLPVYGMVRLTNYDLCGREAAVLTEDRFAAGHHDVTWNAGDLQSGVYLARCEFGSVVKMVKLVLMK